MLQCHCLLADTCTSTCLLADGRILCTCACSFAVILHAYSDGEVAFIEIIENFFKNNCSTKQMREKNVILKGCVNLSWDKEKLLIGSYIPRIGLEGSVKSEGRDELPSPYTTGLLDKFLDGVFVPSFETARGCPFLCAFCDQGLDKTKITAFSAKRIRFIRRKDNDE